MQPPCIIFFGSRGSGKSCLINEILGHYILPTNSTIGTRRPIIIRCHRRPAAYWQNGQYYDLYAEFLHRPNLKFCGQDAIRQEIIDETYRITGNDTAICSLNICLDIYGCNFDDVMFVDLPGLSDAILPGQSSDTDQQLKKIVLEYACRIDTIRVAVYTPDENIESSSTTWVINKIKDEQNVIRVINKAESHARNIDWHYISRNCRNREVIDLFESIVDKMHFSTPEGWELKQSLQIRIDHCKK